MRRMDKYSEENKPRMSRLDKNRELYQNISTNQIYTNITDVTNANAFEIPTITNIDHTTREAYQTLSKYQKIEPIDKNKKELEDFKNIYQKQENKIYDINSVMEEARKSRSDSDLLEKKRSLKDSTYNILLNDNKDALEKYREEKRKRILTPEEEEMREIIDTIATKTIAGEIDKEITVDLLSDLMATNMLDKVEGVTSEEKVYNNTGLLDELKEKYKKEENNQDKEEEKEEEKKEENESDTDFYSRSTELNENDFELSDEFKEKDLPLPLKVFIFFLVIAIVAVAGYFIFLRLR